MTLDLDNSKQKKQEQKLRLEHMETVLTLSQLNAELLLARQRSSGIEFDVMAVERDHAEGPNVSTNDDSLSDVYDRDALAKRNLAKIESKVETMECHLNELTAKIIEIGT